MKTQIFSWASVCLLSISLASVFNGCVKREFDAPPVEELPSLAATHTLADIISRHTIGGTATQIADSVILAGIVTADDRSGNFYKNIVIQDATAGIQIRVDATSVFNNYPIGRQVFIKAKGLYIGDYNGVPQISGNAAGDGIAEALLPSYLVGGQRGMTVVPTPKTIATITDADINTLIRLDSVQFAAADQAQPYANGVAHTSMNRNIESCDGATVILRSSGYAEFANQSTPTGKGSIIAVVGAFNSTKQLYIRELTDVDMSASRCGASANPMTITDLRAAYQGTSIKAPAALISGIVISDKNAGNMDAKNLVIQNGQSGITVRFDAAHTANLGDSVSLVIGNDSLKQYNGLLQVYATVANLTVISTGNVVAPRVTTTSALAANADAWESTLVQIQNATVASGTFSGNHTVTDATGTVTLYTRTAANFASSNIPSGTVAVTGILSDFSGNQLLMRNISDITGGVLVTYLFEETFSSVTTNAAVALAGWTNTAVQGSTLWQGKVYSNNYYAQMSAYQTAQTAVETWLVTPAINLTGAAYLSFETARAFTPASTLTAYISTNFTGNVSTATWTQLNATIAQSSSTQYTFIPSGDIDLSAYTGQNVYVAFKYLGGDPSGTMTYQVDNVRVRLQ